MAELTARAPRRRFAPTRGSIGVGLALAAGAALLYLAARETSVFAVRTIRVDGVQPGLARKVEAALQPVEGTSLLKLDGNEVEHLATALPQVERIGYDRAFPNTLRVHVVAERPLAVLRRGPEAWIVATTGRVIARVAPHTHESLPRIWVAKTADVTLGADLPPGSGAEQVGVLLPARSAGLRRVTGVTIDKAGQVTYVLRGHVEVRAGTADELPLKLTIARRILAATPVAGYLDVSVPERPVALADPQLSTTG